MIGGPPCQAYSLVGRARSKGKVGYVPEKDERHYLFREYIRVLDRLRPAAFVMENVKGMLSSTVESRLVFELLMEDLSSLGTKKANHYVLKWSWFFGQVCGFAKMHLFCVHAAFRISVGSKYAASGVRLSSAV
ncbi:C-5 cytosine-specific DNA methylase [Shimia gijangensis]|uniref:C-5 cytosine-specific DNA methylase n=1 Tax=Shimia gijangensis TaxID=1470563 RepID=A0A1M6T3Q0_9RHOB|nr:DNA cytosine methyltransferase [Shimia gijangensis]SHK51519.1 C-5 cytosine-specific DNA methylase [Shimia gijangensis]